MRRNYNLKKLPKNKKRIRIHMGAIVGVLNFQKRVTHRSGMGRYAQNDLMR